MKKPIIIDCDTGTDDAIALICAHLCKEIDVIGITTVSGNVELDYTSENTLNLVDEIGWNIDVVKGKAKPLSRDLITASHIHGRTGLGDVVLKRSTRGFYDEEVASYIYKKAKENNGEMSILTLGPMTNIANAILRYPDIKDFIKEIVFMGGSLKGGNVTSVAEFNIYVDPEAANIVLESGIPLTMVGLDVTEKVIMTETDRDYFKEFNNPHANITAKILDFMFKRSERFGREGALMHDGLALASMVLPELLKKEKHYARVETEGKITTGMVVVDKRRFAKDKKNVDIALDVDVNMFKSWMRDLICY